MAKNFKLKIKLIADANAGRRALSYTDGRNVRRVLAILEIKTKKEIVPSFQQYPS